MCVSSITDSGAVNMSVFGIYLCSRICGTKRLPPIKFGTAREEELEDWVGTLNFHTCDMRTNYYTGIRNYIQWFFIVVYERCPH